MGLVPQPRDSFQKSFFARAPIAAGGMATVSILVFIGWQFDISFFKSLIPGLVAMNPLTALLFLLSSIWLLLVYFHSQAGKTALGLACMVAVLALLKLSTFAGLPIPIDQLLYTHQLLRYVPTNTMAPNTALNFFLISLAMIAYATRLKSRIFLGQFLVFVAGILSFLALAGYIYGADFLYTIGPFIGMALHTAILFCVFLFGFFALNPHDGFMRVLTSEGSGSLLSRQLLLLVLIVPFLFGFIEVLGLHLDYYSAQTGTVFVVVALSIVFGGFIWRDATRVETIDEDRRRVIADLGQQKEQLDQVQASEEQLLQHLPVGVFMVDAQTGRVVIVNPRGVELLGRGVLPEAGPASYGAAYDVLKEDGTPYPESEIPINIVLREGREVVKNDVVVRKPNGEKTNLHVIGVPIKDAQGKLRFGIAVFDDITKEKEIDRAKTEFVSLASHQLRTPLTSVNWYSEMLLKGAAAVHRERQQEYLTKINTGSERMVALVDALLNVSRIELGTLTVDPKPVDLIALCRDVVAEQSPHARERGVEVSTVIPSEISELETDPNLLRMVIQNLLSNAIKYTPPGGQIRLSVERRDDLVELTISDTGYGIPQKDRDKIFTKMFRADNIKEKGESGTGLGLYIVKAALEALGGSIRFVSEENKGTTFFAQVPLMTNKVHTETTAPSATLPT